MNHLGSQLLFAQKKKYIADSDLRSRWERIREKLWHCMTKKKGRDCVNLYMILCDVLLSQQPKHQHYLSTMCLSQIIEIPEKSNHN